MVVCIEGKSIGNFGVTVPGAWGGGFAALERELLNGRRFRSRAKARMVVFHFIEGFHNPTKRHSSVGYLSPIECEAMKMLMKD